MNITFLFFTVSLLGIGLTEKNPALYGPILIGAVIVLCIWIGIFEIKELIKNKIK